MTELEKLRERMPGLPRCELCETRTNVVFGVGPEDAKVMFIGEGPGENEDLQGEPFVGRAGKLLDDMLELIDLDRTKVYIANMVKCRPPKNRDPLPDGAGRLRALAQPPAGAHQPAHHRLPGPHSGHALHKPDFKITREHGQWFEKDGRRVMALYHPAALLRDPSKRPETFDDLKRIQAAIAPER